jgi:hypothetical protein
MQWQRNARVQQIAVNLLLNGATREKAAHHHVT